MCASSSIAERLRPKLLLAAWLAAALASCGQSSDPGPAAARPETAAYVDTGDLDALVARGKLRILLLNQGSDETYLPRSGSVLDFELRTASDFARSVGLEPVVSYVARFDEFISRLREGHGDLIAANLTITEDRKEHIAFTVPLLHARQVLLARRGDEIAEPAQLAGRTISVRRSTTFWNTAERLASEHAGLELIALPEDLSEEAKLDMLVRGDIDLTLHDDIAFEAAAHFHDELKVAFPASPEQPIAWGVRKEAVRLKEALDRYLNREQLIRVKRERFADDLDGIKKRKTLRVVTRNNAATYFLWRGELLGFEYEMTRAFAEQHGLRLEVLVAPQWQKMLPMLLDGEADVAAAFLTPTENRRAMGVVFSRPYSHASEVIVTRSDDAQLDSLEQLAGRTLTVRESSSYWQTLEPLRERYGFRLEAAPEDEETETIIARVASGDYDLTLADSNILDIELTWRDDVKAAFPLGDPIEHAWAVRNGSPKLLKAINAFLKKQYRSTFYNLTYAKYFKSESSIRQHKQERIDLNPDGSFSPFDDIVKRHAEEFGFDWRLLLAQIYQESRFDPKARSWAGALGLMQVLPRTARHVGIDGDLSDPESGIRAGAKYLDWVRERFEAELPVRDRMWFTLAGYNAGAGHVRDARRLAQQMGWNPNRWFGNVERAMLLLSKPKYARKARHGYVRGREPVEYVRQIRQRYQAYVRLTETTASAPGSGEGKALF